MQKLIIPGKLPGLNDLLHGHWASRSKTKAEAMKVVGWCCKEQKIAQVGKFATAEIRCYEPNAKRDDDNVTGGAAKIILDALQNMGILAGDGRKYLRCVKHPADIDRNNPRIEVTIYESPSGV